MFRVWVCRRIAYGRHYPAAAQNREKSLEFMGVLCALWHPEHFLHDLLLAVGDLRHDRDLVGDVGVLLPLARIPHEDVAGGGFGAFATAASASSGSGGFAFHHACVLCLKSVDDKEMWN
jgi:hypothetical protein